MAQCLPVWQDALTAPGAPRTPRGTEPHRPLRLDTWGRLLYWFLQPPPQIRFNTRSSRCCSPWTPFVVAFFYYNLVRTHQTLRIIPAMAAGACASPIEIGDIVRILEVREASQRANCEAEGWNRA